MPLRGPLAGGADVADESSVDRDEQIPTIALDVSKEERNRVPARLQTDENSEFYVPPPPRSVGASFAPGAAAYRSAHGRLDSVESLKRRPRRTSLGPGGRSASRGTESGVCRAARSIEDRLKMRLVERDVSGGRRQRRKQIGRGGGGAAERSTGSGGALHRSAE